MLRWVRLQDIVWLLLFTGLHFIGPERNNAELQIIIALAILQPLIPRVRFFSTDRGTAAAVAIQLLLGYLLIGVTNGVESSYFWILLLPIATAATSFGVWGTVFFTAMACALYLSFLLFLDFARMFLPEAALREIGLRTMFFAFIAYLIYELSEDTRREARNYQAANEKLAEMNQSLHKAEEAMRRSERLAALGQLTAGLAHELRNPLGTMKNSAELLARRIPPDETIGRELAGYIQTEVDRANSLITRFLQFARPFQLRLEPTELTPILDRAITQVERHVPPFPVDFVRNYAPGVPPVPMDAALLEQVFVNLLTNAAQASPASGVVTVKTRSSPDTAEIAVIDRGSGIAPEIRDSIFNPFFTTKSEGVGLGLAIVQKIVDEHGGRILVESEPGGGAVFRVYLPLQAAPVQTGD